MSLFQRIGLELALLCTETERGVLISEGRIRMGSLSNMFLSYSVLSTVITNLDACKRVITTLSFNFHCIYIYSMCSRSAVLDHCSPSVLFCPDLLTMQLYPLPHRLLLGKIQKTIIMYVLDVIGNHSVTL